MKRIFEESDYIFDFSAGIAAEIAEKPTVQGTMSVDFIVETERELLYIEVKNPDNENARPETRKQFFTDIKEKTFHVDMGRKIKESLLKKYASGYVFEKPVRYIFILQAKDYRPSERKILWQRIFQHIPTGLNKEEFRAFTRVDFELYNIEQFQAKVGFAVAPAQKQV